METQTVYRSRLADDGHDHGWTTVCPRDEIGPEFSIVDGGWGDEAGALQAQLPGVTGGQSTAPLSTGVFPPLVLKRSSRGWPPKTASGRMEPLVLSAPNRRPA